MVQLRYSPIATRATAIQMRVVVTGGKASGPTGLPVHPAPAEPPFGLAGAGSGSAGAGSGSVDTAAHEAAAVSAA